MSEEGQAKEYSKAKEVTTCFKSLALEGDNSPIGIMNLFYTKVFEPVVAEPAKADV